MKKLNRLFALALAMLMCICLVFATSCGEDTSGDDAPISSGEGYSDANYEVFDMGGDTIHLLGFYNIMAMGETASTEDGLLSI